MTNVKQYLNDCRALGIEVQVEEGTGFTVKRPDNFERLPPCIQWSINKQLGLDGGEVEEIGYASKR